MKSTLLMAAVLLVSASARAEQPPGQTGQTSISTADDDAPGAPNENAPDDTAPPTDQVPDAPKDAPAKDAPAKDAPAKDAPKKDAPAHKARMAATRAHHDHVAKDDGESHLDKKEDTVAGGRHWRIKTAEGAVHVWIPPGYDRETAGTVVYVHGYWVDADAAWRDYDLAKQFKASHQNAMFIVPDAPASNDDAVNWPALTDLRRAVTRANIHLPDGPVVVMGHSGAFRTIMQWVDHRLVDQIILLDAMYAGESAFDEYIDSGKHADEHKLIVVGANTAQASEAFVDKYKFAVAREKMPDTASDFSKKERRAKLLYVRSQYEHMQIVTSGKVIPVLLHLTPLKSV
ncbi:MAG TPA: hypothetical protein VH914_13155 [Acidimicrobiia bacterium]|jgi:hypothetical protein|nr:hypothetical protein [Acidimicrobiia bacterium]